MTIIAGPTGNPPILDGCDTFPPLNRHSVVPSKGKRNRKAEDRFAVLNNFVDFTMRDLKAADVRVWMVLYRDTKDGTAATGQSDIARRAGITPRSVGDAIKRLEQMGLLKVVYRGGLNRGVSRYRILPLTQEA